MNQDDKKEKAEEVFFNNLFQKKEKESNEQLYKNEFFILEEEMKSNKDQNSLQFMHDALLNKLMLEDYSPFPPKNDEPTIVNNQKEEKKKEDEQDKLIEEENEFLRSLHRINYLTFSPFGLSFFDDNNKDQNVKEEYLKEREEKILQMINFNYNEFEVTNDLLLNICQGFVDINKLKEENLVNHENLNTNNNNSISTSSNTLRYDPNPTNINLINDVSTVIKEKKEYEKDEDELSEDELFDAFNQKKKIDFYKDLIKQYNEEAIKVNKNERKNFIKKWKGILKEKDKEYEEYMKKQKEEEKKRKLEEKRLKEIERRKEKEKQEQLKSQNMLKKGLEQIVQKAKKKGIINKSSSSSPKKLKKRKKNWEKDSPKKSLNNSMLSNRNPGNNTSFVSRIGLNKSLVSSKRKKSEKSINKNSDK